MNIRHLGTAYALIDPAHHVSEDALAIIVELQLQGEKLERASGIVNRAVSDCGGRPLISRSGRQILGVISNSHGGCESERE